MIGALVHNGWSTKAITPADLFSSLARPEDPKVRTELLQAKMMTMAAIYGSRGS